MAVPKKVLKRQTLRNIEYYGLQEIFDELYQKSLENRKFRNLMELILMEENIKLAYRNMKKNDGSTTPGVDGKTIEHLAKMTEKRSSNLSVTNWNGTRRKPSDEWRLTKVMERKDHLGLPRLKTG